MLQSFSVLLQGLTWRPSSSPPAVEIARDSGPRADTDTYRSNLRFIRDRVLPAGWRLCAVQKWDAHGQGIRELAPAAVAEGANIAVLYNWEARAAAAARPERLLRIKPANFLEAGEAAAAGWGLEELVGPGNLADVAAAAQDAGATIPVHLYLFQHYGDPWGWELETAGELQDLVGLLDPRLELRGIMTHLSGYDESQKPEVLRRFLSVAVPVARSLAPHPLALHWADSAAALQLLGPDGRMVLPTSTMGGTDGTCSSLWGPQQADQEGSNIEWWARLGKLTYGSDPAVNKGSLGGNVAPVMRWTASVASVGWEDVVGQQRLVATVELSKGRYPTPAWWAGADAYAASSLNDLAQPAAYVAINGQRLRLAAVPCGDGRLVRVDVTEAQPAVRPGDTVCLLGDDHGLKDLAEEMGADDYNTALCLRGAAPVEGTDWWPPACVLPF